LWLSPFKLLLYEIDVLWSALLKCLFPSFPPGLGRNGGVRSVLLPLRYIMKVMTSLCSLIVGSSSRGGGTRVPFYLVGDIVAY